VHNWGVIGKRTAIGQFSPNFAGAPGAKTMGEIQKKLRGAKWTNVLYAHVKFGGDRWTHGDRR